MQFAARTCDADSAELPLCSLDRQLHVGQSALVVMSSFPSLDELLWLFECEPEVQFVDEGWPVSAATWTTMRGSFEVACTIVPYEGSLQVTISTAGEAVAHVDLLGVVDVITVDRSHGAEALEARCLPGARLEPVRLQLKPHVSVSAATAPPWRHA